MTFKKGDPNINRAGRKKGAQTKRHLLTDEQRKQLATLAGGITPLEFLMSILRDDDADLKEKLEAAKIAAPYMHRKMPIAIEGTDKPLMIVDPSKLAGLTEKELALYEQLLARLAGAAIKEASK